MSTYLINHLRIPGDVPNEASLSYLEQVEATVKPFGGKWLAQGQVQVVEGSWPGSVVLMEFPDSTQLKNWYDSAAYQKILHLRVENAISDLIIIDGLDADFSVAGFAKQIRASLLSSKKVDWRPLTSKLDQKRSKNCDWSSRPV
jgi:uncharacterized protein (DUF1330 family)